MDLGNAGAEDVNRSTRPCTTETRKLIIEDKSDVSFFLETFGNASAGWITLRGIALEVYSAAE
jgi:hypothetical protein